MLRRGLAPAHPPHFVLMSGVKNSAASAKEHHLPRPTCAAGGSREAEGGQGGGGLPPAGPSAGHLLSPPPPPAWLGAPAKAPRLAHAGSSSAIKFSSCSRPSLPVQHLDTEAHACRHLRPRAARKTDQRCPPPSPGPRPTAARALCSRFASHALRPCAHLVSSLL